MPSQFEMLARMLDAAHLRQRVIAGNIANVNTPAYHRLDVTFEDALARQTRARGTAGPYPEPKIVEGGGAAERADGNNVDIDDELGRLTKNTLLANAYTQILASRLSALRSAVTGR